MTRSRTERLALGFLAVGSPGVFAASLVPGRAATWAFALLAGAFPVALMALGTASRGRAGRPARGSGAPARVLLALLVVLEGTAAGILLLAGAPAGAAGPAGLPLATVVQVLGLWLLPLPLATIGYALTFDRTGVTEEDLARLRERSGSSRG